MPLQSHLSIHNAPTKSRRKILILMEVEKKKSKINQNSINEVKNRGKCWDLNPYIELQNPVVLPTVPWKPLELLTNVSKIIKTDGPK